LTGVTFYNLVQILDCGWQY